MKLYQIKSIGAFLAKQTNIILSIVSFFIFITANNAISAVFLTYSGDTSVETAWQSAAGNTVLEEFESFANDVQISSLPLLGITFDELAGGGFPNTYFFSGAGTPYGSMNLANFPNGINDTNRYDDIVLHVLPGYLITALGFWNADGQSATLSITAYDASDNILGSVGALNNTFAGFISDVPVAKVIFEGNTGDGWNHLDGLQTNAIPVPEPSAIALFLCGIFWFSKNLSRK